MPNDIGALGLRAISMTVQDRDVGLVRAIGPWGLAANIVNTVVGATIFVVPAALPPVLGPTHRWCSWRARS